VFAWTEMGHLWMVQPRAGLITLLRQIDKAQGMPVLGASFTNSSLSRSTRPAASLLHTGHAVLMQGHAGQFLLAGDTDSTLDTTYVPLVLGRTFELGINTLASF